jgi:asparagine synthase (glutamine-hydrolysing)
MCGFAGYMNLRNKSFGIDQSVLHAMQESIAHRGPDGFRIWSDAEHEIALVHRRLSIIDLSDAGAQPMFDADNQIILCVNGEIYNYRELKKELERFGHAFCSNSDSEVIIYGYKQWGIDRLLERLDGMFAFSLYDMRTRELFLVRDRIGVKPIYVAFQHDIISFASEIKALWTLPWTDKKIRPDAAYHYLTYLATPAPMTMWQEVYKIPAGFYVRIDACKELHVKRWYDLAKRIALHAHDLSERDEVYHRDEVRRLLRSSIERRMMSDVPFGVFLSGGVDSSLNVALMAEYTEQVNTFTVAFSDGPEYNELAWARKISDQFNTKHHELMINESDAFNFFQKMVQHQDEPLGDCVCIPLYFVAKLAKDHGVHVVQVGEGSDELFCGYQNYADYLDLYPRWHMGQKYLPQFARKGMFRAAQKLFPDKVGKLDMMRNWSNDKQFFYGGAVVCNEYMKELQLKCSYTPIQDPMVEKFFPEMQLDDSYAMADWHRAALLKNVPSADELQQMSYLELMHRLPELLLMRVDKMSMATAVEAREPFLDYRLVEYALSMPLKYKYRNGVTKYILKKAAEGIIPNDIIYRKKMGFAAPTTRWFKQGTLFNDYFQDLLTTKKNAWQEVLDFDAVSAMQKKNRADMSIDYSYQLWAIQNLLASE